MIHHRETIYRAVVSSAHWPSPVFRNIMRHVLIQRLDVDYPATRALYLDNDMWVYNDKTNMSPFWRNLCQWLYRKFYKLQLPA